MRTPIPVMAKSEVESRRPDFHHLQACCKIAFLCVFTAYLCDVRAIPSEQQRNLCPRLRSAILFAVSCKFRVKMISFVAKNSKSAHFGHSAAVSAMALASTQPRLETLRDHFITVDCNF